MKLLYIDCCITVHGSASRTAALAETFLSAWRALCPFFGIGEYHFIGAPMQDVKEIDHEALLRDALSQAKALAESF